MGEKRGHTAKLVYDFNTARSLEVELDGVFYRTTANQFRSFGGKRQILNVDDWRDPYYESYEGPVFYLGTNEVVPINKLEPRVMYKGAQDPRGFGRPRKGEKLPSK